MIGSMIGGLLGGMPICGVLPVGVVLPPRGIFRKSPCEPMKRWAPDSLGAMFATPELRRPDMIVHVSVTSLPLTKYRGAHSVHEGRH